MSLSHPPEQAFHDKLNKTFIRRASERYPRFNVLALGYLRDAPNQGEKDFHKRPELKEYQRLHLLAETNGEAIFSTHHGQRPKRSSYDGQPKSIRSDYLEDLLYEATRLQKEFSDDCRLLSPQTLGKTLVEQQRYFDNFDIHYFGEVFLFNVLSVIAWANTLERDERARPVYDFAENWIKTHEEAFRACGHHLQWTDLFGPVEIDQYGPGFLQDVFYRITDLRDRLAHSHEAASGCSDPLPMPSISDRRRLTSDLGSRIAPALTIDTSIAHDRHQYSAGVSSKSPLPPSSLPGPLPFISVPQGIHVPAEMNSVSAGAMLNPVMSSDHFKTRDNAFESDRRGSNSYGSMPRQSNYRADYEPSYSARWRRDEKNRELSEHTLHIRQQNSHHLASHGQSRYSSTSLRGARNPMKTSTDDARRYSNDFEASPHKTHRPYYQKQMDFAVQPASFPDQVGESPRRPGKLRAIKDYQFDRRQFSNPFQESKSPRYGKAQGENIPYNRRDTQIHDGENATSNRLFTGQNIAPTSVPDYRNEEPFHQQLATGNPGRDNQLHQSNLATHQGLSEWNIWISNLPVNSRLPNIRNLIEDYEGFRVVHNLQIDELTGKRSVWVNFDTEENATKSYPSLRQLPYFIANRVNIEQPRFGHPMYIHTAKSSLMPVNSPHVFQHSSRTQSKHPVKTNNPALIDGAEAVARLTEARSSNLPDKAISQSSNVHPPKEPAAKSPPKDVPALMPPCQDSLSKRPHLEESSSGEISKQQATLNEMTFEGPSAHENHSEGIFNDGADASVQKEGAAPAIDQAPSPRAAANSGLTQACEIQTDPLGVGSALPHAAQFGSTQVVQSNDAAQVITKNESTEKEPADEPHSVNSQAPFNATSDFPTLAESVKQKSKPAKRQNKPGGEHSKTQPLVNFASHAFKALGQVDERRSSREVQSTSESHEAQSLRSTAEDISKGPSNASNRHVKSVSNQSLDNIERPRPISGMFNATAGHENKDSVDNFPVNHVKGSQATTHPNVENKASRSKGKSTSSAKSQTSTSQTTNSLTRDLEHSVRETDTDTGLASSERGETLAHEGSVASLAASSMTKTTPNIPMANLDGEITGAEAQSSGSSKATDKPCSKPSAKTNDAEGKSIDLLASQSIMPTRKKKKGGKNATPTKKSFSGTNMKKLSNDDAQATKTPYPKATEGLVTVFNAPSVSVKQSEDISPDSENLVEDAQPVNELLTSTSAFEPSTEFPKKEEEEFKPSCESTSALLSTTHGQSLAQRITQSPEWSKAYVHSITDPAAIKQTRSSRDDQNHHKAEKGSLNTHVQMPKPELSEDALVHLALEAKLECIALGTREFEANAKSAKERLNEMPFRARSHRGDAYVPQLAMNWRKQNEDWITGIPDHVAFSHSAHDAIMREGMSLDQELERFKVKYMEAHASKKHHAGGPDSSVLYHTAVRLLQRSGQRNSTRVTIPDWTKKQALWNLEVMFFLDKQRREGRWDYRTDDPTNLRTTHPEFNEAEAQHQMAAFVNKTAGPRASRIVQSEQEMLKESEYLKRKITRAHHKLAERQKQLSQKFTIYDLRGARNRFESVSEVVRSSLGENGHQSTTDSTGITVKLKKDVKKAKSTDKLVPSSQKPDASANFHHLTPHIQDHGTPIGEDESKISDDDTLSDAPMTDLERSDESSERPSQAVLEMQEEGQPAPALSSRSIVRKQIQRDVLSPTRVSDIARIFDKVSETASSHQPSQAPPSGAPLAQPSPPEKAPRAMSSGVEQRFVELINHRKSEGGPTFHSRLKRLEEKEAEKASILGAPFEKSTSGPGFAVKTKLKKFEWPVPKHGELFLEKAWAAKAAGQEVSGVLQQQAESESVSTSEKDVPSGPSIEEAQVEEARTPSAAVEEEAVRSQPQIKKENKPMMQAVSWADKAKGQEPVQEV